MYIAQIKPSQPKKIKNNSPKWLQRNDIVKTIPLPQADKIPKCKYFIIL